MKPVRSGLQPSMKRSTLTMTNLSDFGFSNISKFIRYFGHCERNQVSLSTILYTLFCLFVATKIKNFQIIFLNQFKTKLDQSNQSQIEREYTD